MRSLEPVAGSWAKHRSYLPVARNARFSSLLRSTYHESDGSSESPVLLLHFGRASQVVRHGDKLRRCLPDPLGSTSIHVAYGVLS